MMVFAATSDPLVDWLTQAGGLGVLAFVVVAFMKGWIVRGTEVDKIRAERDKALELVYKQAEIAHKALSVQEKVQNGATKDA